MHKMLHNIASTDQCAYVRGRYIGTNIRMVNDVIDYFDMISLLVVAQIAL